MAVRKSNKVQKQAFLQRKKEFSGLQVIIFVLAFGFVGAYALAQSFAASSYSTDVVFSPSDGTWPTALLDDPMSVALGRYNSDYGYPGEKTYGPVMNLSGTASGLKTNLTADANVICGQTDPVPHFEYDNTSKQWGMKGNGNELMSLKVYRLSNGSNNAQMSVYGAQVSKIDRTKQMICYAQVYVAQKQGTKLTTSVPITQRFVLDPK